MSNTCPQYLQNYFTFTNGIHSKSLRSAEKICQYIPKPNGEIFRSTYVYSDAAICNSVPHDVKSAPSIKTSNPDMFQSFLVKTYH